MHCNMNIALMQLYEVGPLHKTESSHFAFLHYPSVPILVHDRGFLEAESKEGFCTCLIVGSEIRQTIP
jgi:hypothetical protein